jgi:hypothetical protein
MDITTEAVRDTAALHVKNAKGEHLYSDGKPVRIHVFGPGTEQYAVVEARQTQRVLKRREDNDGKAYVLSPDEARLEQAEDLASITTAFEGLTYPPAGDAQGYELFKAVYADPKLGFIAAQVNKYVQNWGNFSAGSATS